ncbi:MAG: hypothetical protein KDC65_08710 [Saprospiraceae bacterium]|nr:hypothetical protein [Saprospiraceae bacterium]
MLKKIIWIVLTGYCQLLPGQKQPQHFIFFNIDRERIREASFLNEPNIAGAQLKYTWRELETNFDEYDFSSIRSDLDYLHAKGKKLFIQVQDVSFDTARLLVPQYLLDDPAYNGGVAIQYITDDRDSIIRQDGYVPRRWDDRVRARFSKLLQKLGEAFDGKIAGINLPETSVGFGDTGSLYPEGFTPEKYRDAILDQMRVLRHAFQRSVVIQYANFMPGEWLPRNNKGYLESLYRYAGGQHIGMGGPDIKIYKKAQMNHSYRFLKEYAPKIKTGVAVQWGNYEEINPKTGKEVTIGELCAFATQEIGLDYIFWCTQEPYYSERLLPCLHAIKKN